MLSLYPEASRAVNAVGAVSNRGTRVPSFLVVLLVCCVALLGLGIATPAAAEEGSSQSGEERNIQYEIRGEWIWDGSAPETVSTGQPLSLAWRYSINDAGPARQMRWLTMLFSSSKANMSNLRHCHPPA